MSKIQERDTDEKGEGTRSTSSLVPRTFSLLLLLVLVGVLAFVLAVPFLLTHVAMPKMTLDVSSRLKGKAAALVTDKTLTVEAEPWRKDPAGGYIVRAWGRLLDWPYRANFYLRSLFPRVEGDLTLILDEFWQVRAEFTFRAPRNWNFHASIGETPVTAESAVLSDILARATPPAVSNLVFSGTFALDAEGACTPKIPVPVWKVRGSIKDVDAACDVGGKAIDIDNLRTTFGVQGIADRREIQPLYPRVDSVVAAGVVLSNVSASVRATEKSYLVTEAGASCCGGELKLYSLFLDPKKLSAGATIFVDGVDAGEVLSRVSGFRGRASGRLHGKLPFFLKDGRELRFKDAYLFSTPGEPGKLEIFDAQPILDNLGGVAQSERDNLAKVLSNLDYTVLKLELKRDTKGTDWTLGMKIEGSATHAGTTVPVVIAVNFHGAIDYLVNLGMKIKGRKRKETEQ